MKANSLFFAFFLSGIVLAAPQNKDQVVRAKQTHVVEAIQLHSDKKTPQRIIMMVGDGMGIEQVGAAEIANKGRLFMTQLPVTGLVRTTCANHAITDSAAAGTAFATGQKTLAGRLGFNPKGKANPSLARLAHQKGLGIGLVVTKAIYDATPAAFYAQAMSRHDTKAIVPQLLKMPWKVIVGGGKAAFSPEQQRLLKEKTPLLHWLADGHGDYVPKRGPVLPQITLKALETLHQQSPDGFFLLVEGSHIDSACHENLAQSTIDETLDFDSSVGVAMRWAAQHPGTLVLVFADHATGGMCLMEGDTQTGTVRVGFRTGNHNGIFVPMMAGGTGSQHFMGVYENTQIYDKLKRALSTLLFSHNRS